MSTAKRIRDSVTVASGDGECVRRPREYRCRLPGLSTDAPARRPPGPCQNAGRDADLKATPRQDGVEEIRIPGERAYRERNRLAREGIEIDRRIRDALGRLAKGVAFTGSASSTGRRET
jgi:hypothetical protein